MSNNAYGRDEALMRSLGLRTTDFGRAWTDLGSVVVEEAEPHGEYGPRPASIVEVEVMALPAQCWRFTVRRPRDGAETLLDGRVRGVYFPLEVRIISTGSGRFSEFWPMAEMIAQHILDVECGEP